MMRLELSAAALSVLICAISIAERAVAQTLQPAPRLRVLTGPGEVLDHGFTMLGSLVELRDGRLLVTDEKDNAIFLVDFKHSSTESRSRIGSGPGEYRRVGRLWGIGDTTVMFDRVQQAAVIFIHDSVLSIGAASRYAIPRGQVVGVDRRRVITAVVYASASNTLLSDSLLVVRSDARTPRLDTIARIQPERREAPVRSRPTNLPASERKYMIPIVVRDQVLSFSDGWTAIARVQPYRIDWCDQRRCRNGTPLPLVAATMSDLAKAQYLKVLRGATGFPPTDDLARTIGWPDVVPPFVAPTGFSDQSALMAMPDGGLLVRRVNGAAGDTTTYDQFDRRGHLTGRLLVPSQKWILGFGRARVYLVATDADGLQFIERHRWVP